MVTATSARPTLLLGERMPRLLAARLRERCEVIGPLGAPFPDTIAAMAPEDAHRVQALVCMGSARITPATMDQLPALRLVGCLGSGYEGVDLEAARERGIIVTHSPGANASDVADLGLGLMIASLRRMHDAGAWLREGNWEQRTRRLPRGSGLTGRRLGIYGMGTIGEKIARRAVACEMKVGYHNRKPRDGAPYAWHPTLSGLAVWADVLMIAVRAGPDTRHAVDAGVLKALGSAGHLINISRGSVVDEDALVAALQNNVIAGAGLDVFEHEPGGPRALRPMTNVVLTPHIGGDTGEAETAMTGMVVANVEAFFAGRPVPNRV